MPRIFSVTILGVLFAFHVAAQDVEKWDLQKCIEYAMEHNLTVQQSRLNIERAEVGVRQSKYDLLPDLNAQATYGYNFGQRIDPFTNEFATNRVQSNNFFMSSSLDLFNGFSKMNTIKGNKEFLLASQYDLETIQNDIALQICLAYLQILRNKENVAISEAQIQLTEKQVTRTEKLVNAGQEPQGALYDAQSQKAQEEFNLVNAQNGVDIAILNLTQLMQLPREEAKGFDIIKPDLSDEGKELLQNSVAEIFSTAMQEMPQIQAAEHNIAVAEYDVKVADGNLYPRLSISGSVGSGYSGANNVLVGEGTNLGQVPFAEVATTGDPVIPLQDQIIYGDDDYQTKKFGDQLEDNFNQNLQLNLNIPIFNGMAVRANKQRAEISRREATINYEQVRNQLRFDIEQAYADAKAAMNRFLAAKKAVQAFRESFNYAEVRYEQSVINAVQYNDIKTRYTNAQSDMTNAKYDFVFRTKILDFYLGNPITL